LYDKIKELNLTDEEAKDFEEFVDPITEDYMAIPVMLNEKYYDLSTLLRMKRQDPTSREAYNPLELQSGRNLINKLEAAITSHTQKRVAQNAEVVSNAIGAPGGPRM
jgi:hypothetical protein